MKYNIKLILAYDGSAYHGWQKTEEGPSIEACLMNVLEKILQHKVVLQAASRTDAGVHSQGQVINFFTNNPLMDLKKFQLSSNQLLPKDIQVVDIEYTDSTFHPTLDSLFKEYHYNVTTSSFMCPFKRQTFWHFPQKLDVNLMRKGAELLIGKKDFKAFTNFKKNPHKDTVREVFSIEILENNEDYSFKICGDHFLYKMIRNIVGSLCYLGCNKLSIDSFSTILTEKLRAKAGVTAPACGLILKKIHY